MITEDETVGWHLQLNGHEFEQVQTLVTAMSLLFLIVFLKMCAKSKKRLPKITSWEVLIELPLLYEKQGDWIGTHKGGIWVPHWREACRGGNSEKHLPPTTKRPLPPFHYQGPSLSSLFLPFT